MTEVDRSRCTSGALVLLGLVAALGGCSGSIEGAARDGGGLAGDAGGDAPGPVPDGGVGPDGGGPGLDGGVGPDGGGAADGGGLADGGPLAGGMRIGTNFWNIGWGIWDDVFKSGVDWATTTDPWNPAFVAEIQPYAVLRFMDWAAAFDNPEVAWSDRLQPTAMSSAVGKVAYEWMIDLANRTGIDMWVCVPTYANDDYVTQLATLIATTLDPRLYVYVEWTNEAWNYQQPRDESCRYGDLVVPGDGDRCAKGYVYRSLQVFQRFEAVFGADNPRLIKVVAGQSVNTWLTGIHLAALDDAAINPDGVTATAYAIAPYFGHGVDGAAGSALADLRASMTADGVGSVTAQAQALQASGLALIAYEGGQHVLSGADVINANAGMYQLYLDYFTAIAPDVKVFAHYLHNGEWSSGGAWGAERHVGQPLAEAHKLRAINDWIAAHP